MTHGTNNFQANYLLITVRYQLINAYAGAHAHKLQMNKYLSHNTKKCSSHSDLHSVCSPFSKYIDCLRARQKISLGLSLACIRWLVICDSFMNSTNTTKQHFVTMKKALNYVPHSTECLAEKF